MTFNGQQGVNLWKRTPDMALGPHELGWQLSAHSQCDVLSATGWGDAHEQGDVGQGPILPVSVACFSPKLQPCACCGAKPMQLSQRKPMKREMWW